MVVEEAAKIEPVPAGEVHAEQVEALMESAAEV
jgi:hypothetical protein